jgi:hypothetical protein
MQVTAIRKYDGYRQKGELVSRTRCTLMVQFPGYRTPVKFRETASGSFRREGVQDLTIYEVPNG